MTWQAAWEEGRTPWDAGRSAPTLVELVAGGTLPAGRALVPGCGSGYDVLTLASAERSVLGIDLSPLAAARFEALRAERGVDGARARVEVADFFAADLGRFDLVWDCTFLCALPPDLRGAWAVRMNELLADDGELVTLIFPVTDGPADRGPPYPQHPDRVRALLGDGWTATTLERVERSNPGREGREWLGRWRRRAPALPG